MKQKKAIPQLLLWLLAAGLLLSLGLNVVQYVQAHPAAPLLRGTYGTDPMGTNGEYLIFDPDGHFCRYTQEQGLLEEGNYTQAAENLYQLENTSGAHSSILLAAEGVYRASPEGSLTLFAQMNDSPVCIGNWSQDWEGWPGGPYEIPS